MENRLCGEFILFILTFCFVCASDDNASSTSPTLFVSPVLNSKGLLRQVEFLGKSPSSSEPVVYALDGLEVESQLEIANPIKPFRFSLKHYEEGNGPLVEQVLGRFLCWFRFVFSISMEELSQIFPNLPFPHEWINHELTIQVSTSKSFFFILMSSIF